MALALIFMLTTGTTIGWLLQPALLQGVLITVRHLDRDFSHQYGTVMQTQRAPINTLPQMAAVSPKRMTTVAATNGPLRVNPVNPRYFADASGQVVYLTGSHTWASLQDNGGGDPPPLFDYNQYLDFLQTNNHNFFRLWTWEESRWTTETSDPNYWFNPMPPFQRTGPGLALDGKAKFDVTQLEQAYFDHMRERIVAAQARGIYVSIMLFNGWSVANAKGGLSFNNPWAGHPFNAQNNINGLNGDPDNDDSGLEVHTLAMPAITAVQEAYVKKVIDTVNDLDNVLYEISNESDGSSTAWQYHLINFIKAYEAAKPYQHPVGMTVEYFGGDNDKLFQSPADWISPNGPLYDPMTGDGRKVILHDTDHLCGICGDRRWVWMAFTRGLNPIFMDGYDGAGYGVGGADFSFDNPTWVSLRRNLGYTRAFATRMDIAAMTPQNALASSGYALAKLANLPAEYLVYLPDGGAVTVDLTAVSGPLTIEWFNPELGASATAGVVNGGAVRTLTAPFAGDAVLYLVQQAGTVAPTNTPPPPPTLTTPPTNTSMPTNPPPNTPMLTPTNTTNSLAQLGNRVWHDTNRNGIQDTGEPGVPGVMVNLLNGCSDLFVLATRTTDTNGYYGFNKLIPGQYRLQVRNLPAGYSFSPQNQATNEATDSDIHVATAISDCIILAAGQATNNWDAGISQATAPTLTPTLTPTPTNTPGILAQLGNRVLNDANRNGILDTGEVGVPGVTISLLNGCSSNTVLAVRTTDANGYYGFNKLIPGQYRLQVSKLPAGYTFSPQDQGANEAADSDVNVVTGLSPCINLVAGQIDNSWDVALMLWAASDGSLGDLVWLDANGDGLVTSGEVGVPTVTVVLLSSCTGNMVLAATQTNSSGLYRFTELRPGQYRIQLNLPIGYGFSLPNQGADETVDSDLNPTTSLSDCITIGEGQYDTRWDVGLKPIQGAGTAAVGDHVWNDLDLNGLQRMEEVSLAGAKVGLYSNGTLLSAQQTDAGGNFLFSNLAPGSYYLCFQPPLSPHTYMLTGPLQGTDPTLDSNPDLATGCTANFTLRAAQLDLTRDAGFFDLPPGFDVGAAVSVPEIDEQIGVPALVDPDAAPADMVSPPNHFYLPFVTQR